MFVLVAWLVPPPSRGIDRRRFDFVGAVGLGCGLIALLLPISRGAEWGWTSTLVVGLFAAAVVILLVWAWWELRASAPLVDLRAAAAQARRNGLRAGLEHARHGLVDRAGRFGHVHHVARRRAHHQAIRPEDHARHRRHRSGRRLRDTGARHELVGRPGDRRV